ncbi:MAG: bifunctional glutamate N-acetyltransferase/amino-acid acetyltransferase ArgJ [Helicobacteraceae bacterium]|jgi:glutamate N-acetyltransferase/amino-acid N-acetyltransferase|nr:bifunctional glutamate N-acetyltransferase/amino-acid acetyltransferase ArgJ [Helicobacteraceae bacterium]
MEILSIGGGVCAPKGFFADGLNCGLKPNGGGDLAFIRSSTPCDLAAVFTSNRFACAHIRHAKAHKGKVNGIIANSKNANAMSGSEGVAAVERVVAAVPFENFLMASTGVIGVPLPVEKIIGGIGRFDWNAVNGGAAAKAIMTTDRWEKQIAFEVRCNGETFTIGAMAKGAGMIAPQLATMLCFVTTDAAVHQEALQAHLNGALDDSFNAISVDGDMSTNDTIYLLANGSSGAYDAQAFDAALRRALHFLALEIVRDGEGATKLAAFEVKNAATKEEAKRAAKMLSNSLLVKTALFGADPNWGRIASTIGAAQIECDAESLTISIGGVTVYEKGRGCMDKEREKAAAAALRTESFRVVCDLGIGTHSYTAYGCDLGYEYVKINADYRT